VIYVGPTGELDPIPITGTLAYISNRNAWIMRGSSTTKRPLTTTSDLDERVFRLALNGQKLLFTRETPVGERDTFFNQLWLITNTAEEVNPVQLVPGNILYADWVPGRDNTISYSTAESRPNVSPGWNALNDLWLMRLDPLSGEALNVDQLVEPSSGGLYGWWGTQYQWSQGGEQLAWIRADSIGLVNLETGSFNTLLTYPVLSTSGDWSWRATVSWSPDNALLATTVHGAPVGSELPQTSPAFNVAVTDMTGSFQAEIVESAGIWAAPHYSPIITTGEFPRGYLAYLRAREPFNSITGEYDLVVADRDGSNARVVFPDEGQAGLDAQEFVWSPDGRQIAFIYLGNLWIIDVETAIAHQLTLDGGASSPHWTQ
jgi:resuscitation-promoting factor RpfB